jgi:hypothetical protein
MKNIPHARLTYRDNQAAWILELLATGIREAYRIDPPTDVYKLLTSQKMPQVYKVCSEATETNTRATGLHASQIAQSARANLFA